MLTENLAHYVLALEDAAASATHVADRPVYEKYRATPVSCWRLR